MNGDDAPPGDGRPVLRIDPTTGRPILMAPQRRFRPFLTGPGAAEAPCPFCPGNESETPPEVDACRADGSAPDAPGWRVRVFPNKYPANDHHEVIAESAHHCEQPGDLGVEDWVEVVAMWQRRVDAIERAPGVRCAFLFKNVGALAGASIEHNHSQVIGLDRPPPRLLLERDAARALPRCPWCATLAGAAAEGRMVAASARHAVLVPDPPKLPYETWLLPVSCDDDFLRTDRASLAQALHALFRAVLLSLDRPAFNLWLHRLPGEPSHRPFHWHFELQPRTGTLAGLELGGDMYINSLRAPEAAARLRGERRASR